MIPMLDPTSHCPVPKEPVSATGALRRPSCRFAAWQAHGFLRALEIEDGDMDAFANMMRQLMLAIFHEQKDR